MIDKVFVSEQLEQLKKEIANLDNFIANCPDCKLITRRQQNGSYKYALKKKDEDGVLRQHYLNRDQMQLAKLLAKRDYAIACRKDKQNEKWFLEQTLAHEERESEAEKLLLSKPGIAQLVIPTLKVYDDYVTEWQNADYVRSNYHPEHLIIPTIVRDLYVRSKSEEIITNFLVQKSIPFRYEEVNKIGKYELCPDFTCMNPRTHEIFYLEHYGKVDDPGYMADQRRREDLYRKIGVYPWKNLLITTEAENRPLDIRWLEQIANYYLL